jgi:hypothetical protein
MSSIIPEDPICFRLASLEEIQSQTLNKRYNFVDYCSDSQEANANHFEEQVWIVPEQFPFVFKLAKRQFEQFFTPRELHAVFKQLNTMRRIQLVRSTISLKIITQNIKLQKGLSLGSGTLGISFLDPLTSSTLRATKHSFNLQEIDDFSVANIDLEHQAQMNPTAQVGVWNKCNLIQFELKFETFSKAQKCILFYGDFKKIRKSDLFYCFLNLRADINLKLYFVAPSAAKTGRPANFSLVKIQIVTTSLGLDKSCSTLKSSIRRSSKLNQKIQNYRFNIAPASSSSKEQTESLFHEIYFSQQSDSLRTINFSGSHKEKNINTDRTEALGGFSSPRMSGLWIEDADSRRSLQPSGLSIKGIRTNPTQSGSDVRRVGGRMSVSPPEVESFQPSKGRDCWLVFEPTGNTQIAKPISQATETEKKTSGHYFMGKILHTGPSASGYQAQGQTTPENGAKRTIHLQEHVCRRE